MTPTDSRRSHPWLAALIRDNEVVQKLFGPLALRYKTRPGG
jgi:ribosomal protein L17